MSARRTITFDVPALDDGPPRWLAAPTKPPDKPTRPGDWTTDRERALRFTMYVRPTNGERPVIDLRMAAILGDAAKLSQLEASVRVHRELAVQEVADTVWPDGKPDGIVDPLEHPDFQTTWNDHASDARLTYERQSYVLSEVSLAAAWPQLIVGAPAGWGNLADLEVDASVIKAIIYARNAALRELDPGNGHASG